MVLARMAVLCRVTLACCEHRNPGAWAGPGIQAALVWVGTVDNAGWAARVVPSAAVGTAEGLR